MDHVTRVGTVLLEDPMTNTIRTDATTTHGVSHDLFSALLDEFDTLKERVATLEREMNHNHDCYKHGCYRTPDKPFHSLAELTYEAVCWCQANHMTIEFLHSGVRITEQYEPYRQRTLGCAFKSDLLHAVDAMKQNIMEATSTPTLLFQDAKLGQKVQFYDHKRKVWRNATVLIITNTYDRIDTITLHPAEGADITMSHQSWDEVGVRVRPIFAHNPPTPNQPRDTTQEFVPANFDKVQPGDRVIIAYTDNPLIEVVNILVDTQRTKIVAHHINDSKDQMYSEYDRVQWDSRSPVYAKCRGYIP